MRYGIPEPERPTSEARSNQPPPILGLDAVAPDEPERLEPQRREPDRTPNRRSSGPIFFFGGGSE